MVGIVMEIRVVLNIMGVGYRLYIGTSYLEVPKTDPNFGNYPPKP